MHSSELVSAQAPPQKELDAPTTKQKEGGVSIAYTALSQREVDVATPDSRGVLRPMNDLFDDINTYTDIDPDAA